MFYYSLQKLCLKENFRKQTFITEGDNIFPRFLLLLLLLLEIIGDREWKDGI